MTWKDTRKFCSKLGAKMVMVESEQERKELTNMLATLIAKKKRFWLDVKKIGGKWKTHKGTKDPSFTPWGSIKCVCHGNCIRSGPDMMWYKAPCGKTRALWEEYTFNPLCKKPFAA